jgi:hypothetical protein
MPKLYSLKSHESHAEDIRDEMPSFIRMSAQSFLSKPMPDGRTGKGVKVCVIGTGIADHRSLKHSTHLANLGPSKHSRDNHGHSHIVAGLIAAKDSASFVGLAPDATLACVKATDDSGVTSAESIAAAALWAAVMGVQVAVISHVIDFGNSVVANAVEKAAQCNVVIVVEEPVGEAPEHVICVKDFPLKLPEGEIMSLYTDGRYIGVTASEFRPALLAGLVALLVEKQAGKFGVEKLVHIVKRQLVGLTATAWVSVTSHASPTLPPQG